MYTQCVVYIYKFCVISQLNMAGIYMTYGLLLYILPIDILYYTLTHIVLRKKMSVKQMKVNLLRLAANVIMYYQL